MFLRELISNASDALEKRKFLDSVSDGGGSDQSAYEIRIETAANRITITDTGVGMDKEELINLLGTIARSGHIQDMDEQTNKLFQGLESSEKMKRRQQT